MLLFSSVDYWYWYSVPDIRRARRSLHRSLHCYIVHRSSLNRFWHHSLHRFSFYVVFFLHWFVRDSIRALYLNVATRDEKIDLLLKSVEALKRSQSESQEMTRKLNELESEVSASQTRQRNEWSSACDGRGFSKVPVRYRPNVAN